MTDNLDGLLSPFLRRQRLRAAKPFLKGRVLDFGCGIGLACELVGAPNYVGVDADERVLAEGRRRFPAAQFLTVGEFHRSSLAGFDCVAGLAVIEHLADPISFLAEAGRRVHLDGSIVITTPNPVLDWAHGLGAAIGLFAKESHAEHQSLMGRGKLEASGRAAGLTLAHYRRFLGGANQLAVFRRAS